MTRIIPDTAMKEQPKTFSNMMRNAFKGVIDSAAQSVNRLGLHPNTLSLIGFFGNLVASVLLAFGNFFTGGLLALVMGLIDVLDGALARLRGEATKFGAFLDSVIDRYSELSLFLGLSYFFATQENWLAILACYIAAAGSVLVSYMRARALSLGLDVQIGLLSRLERYIILIPALLLGYPLIGTWIIAVLANLTAFQRIYFVWRNMDGGVLNRKE